MRKFESSQKDESRA